MIPNALARSFAFAALVALCHLAPYPAYAAEDGLKVFSAWVRLAPPALKVHGGYFTITNEGSAAQELIGASSENYEMVNMHVSRIENGVATMEQVDTIEIPAGGKVEFKPGGLHLMLMGAKTPLTEGGTVPLRLSFRSGAEIEATAMIMKAAPDGSGEMKHMDHGGHGGPKTH